MPDWNAVWYRITEIFKQDNVPQIAKKIGISKQSVYEWQKGGSIALDTLIKIAEEGNASLHWLITGEGNRTPYSDHASLKEGEHPVYFGEYEREVITKLAKEAQTSFDDMARELVLESLKARGLVTDKVEGANLVYFGEFIPELVPIKLLGTIAAGMPIQVFDYEETVLVPETFLVKGRDSYALRVQGESMRDDGILDGDLIVCYASSTAYNGQRVVALIDGEKATIKKFYKENGRIRLQPANPDHEAMIFEPDRVLIQGIVVGLYRTL